MQNLWAQEYQYYLGSRPSHLLCLRAAWQPSTTGSSQTPDCAARPGVWDQLLFADVWLTASRHIQLRKINPIPGSSPRAMSAFLILLLSCSHLPCWGQGFCPFLLSPYLSSGWRRKKAAESNATSSQELAFCSSLSGHVTCSLPHFQCHRGKEKALVICKLWVNFPSG